MTKLATLRLLSWSEGRPAFEKEALAEIIDELPVGLGRDITLGTIEHCIREFDFIAGQVAASN